METKISDLKSEGQLELGTHADTSVAVLKHLTYLDSLLIISYQ